MEHTEELASLAAMRKEIVAKRNAYAKKYESAKGLFGDTQTDEGGLFPETDFTSDEYAQSVLEVYNSQIRRIDMKIRLLTLASACRDTAEQTAIAFV